MLYLQDTVQKGEEPSYLQQEEMVRCYVGQQNIEINSMPEIKDNILQEQQRTDLQEIVQKVMGRTWAWNEKLEIVPSGQEEEHVRDENLAVSSTMDAK